MRVRDVLLAAGTAVLASVFVCAIGAPLITGRQFITNDLGSLYLPFRQFLSNCLRTHPEA